MGHDICGFANDNAPHDDDGAVRDEIAYLRRSAGNPLARSIYEALGAQEHDCGCSGCGGEVHFTEAQLRDALAKLPDGDDYEPERTFLGDCIEKGGGGAWIGFW